MDDVKLKDTPFVSSNLENIDAAMFSWLHKDMDVYTTANDGWKKVPVTWVTPERAFHIKDKKEIHDGTGALVLPLISLERTAVVKDLSKKGTVFANIPDVNDRKGGSITIARRIQQDKTSNFANADSERKAHRGIVGHGQINYPLREKSPKVVYETISIPLPLYVEIMYTITFLSEYQQQMNEMISPFLVKTGGLNYFIVENEGNSYEAFFQSDVTQDNNASNLSEELRQFKSKIDVKVLGYLIGADKNQEKPRLARRENAVEIKIPRERVIVGDIPEHIRDGWLR